jgi:glycosyltransferase involved in cell wall biosynthesis
MMRSTSQLRIALVSHRFAKNDGQGRVNYEVSLAALKRGANVTLVCVQCAEEILAYPNASVVKLGSEWLPTQLLRNLAFASASARWLKLHRLEFDVVLANGFVTWEKCDVVSAHFVHSAWIKNEFYPFRGSLKPYALYQLAYTKLNSLWERNAYLGATKVIAVSEIVRQDLVALGVPADRITVIYNGVDTEEFAPGLPMRSSFALPDGVLLALFVGDIKSPRKNLDTVFQALLEVPEIHLAVAGEVQGSPAPQRARTLGIAERVHFVGKSKRIADLMRSSDMFIFPSRYEAHPLVVLEAMASALPIILSRNVGSVSSFREFVEVLEDANNAKALAILIKKLIASPARRMELGSNARRRALDLEWSKTAESYFQVFDSFSHSASTV